MPKRFYAKPVLEAVPSNYLILDAELRIAAVTDAYCAATMTKREDIVGRPLFDVFPDNPDDPAADGVRVLRASLEQVLSTRKPHRMKVQKYDIRRPDSEGGGFEERYWSPLNSPALAPDGSVAHIIHWVEDVTDFVRMKREMEREQAEMTEELRVRADKLQAETFLRTEALEANKRLSESERRYRFLADTVPQLLWTADSSGMIEYCNERWFSFTGLKLEQLRGRGWLSCVHPDDLERVATSWDAAVARSATAFSEEHRLRFRDGTWRSVLTAAVPYRNHSDRVLQWFGTSTDIHDRVVANEQLRDTQRLQSVGQLAGGMAHEVNNMMTAVMGFGDIVLEALGEQHPQRDDVAEMVKAGARASQVTRQLLAFSRQQVLKPTVLDLNVVIDELQPVLRRMVGSDKRFDVKLSQSGAKAVADRGQIEQVLINLVANARDATRTNGVITIESEPLMLTGDAITAAHEPGLEAGRFVRITVRDDGYGMAPEVKARVFEPFFTTKAVGQGTGLGLSMVYGIVRQSDGFVSIDTSPGVGTAMSIFLPFAREEVSPEAARSSVVRGSGEHILVVEDEPVVRSLARRMLESAGYVVFQAPNGAAALEFLVANSGNINLVLSDIVMPNVNGHQLAQRISELYPGMPVILMSGYSGDDIAQRGLMISGTPLVQKPFTLESLTRAVRDRLALSP